MTKFNINNLVEVNGRIAVVIDFRQIDGNTRYALKFMNNKIGCWFYEEHLRFVHYGYEGIVNEIKEGR